MESGLTEFYRRWAWFHCLVNVSGMFVAYISGSLILWIVINAITILIFLYRMPVFLPDFPLVIGYANWVTVCRFTILIMALSVSAFLAPPVLAVIFLLVIILDGVDGIVARMYRHTSRAGELLDMETDAIFVFGVSFIHYEREFMPFWILIPGGMRYLYGLLFSRLPIPPAEQPPKRIRSFVAVVFFICLLLPFFLPEFIYRPALIIASLLIILSFVISVIYRISYAYGWAR